MTVILDVGMFRQTATLNTRGTPVADGDGGFNTGSSAADPFTWRCAIERASVSNANRHFAASVIAYATHIIRGRFHPEISTLTVVTWTDRDGAVHVANVIDAVDTEGAGVETLIAAVEQTNPTTETDTGWVQEDWV